MDKNQEELFEKIFDIIDQKDMEYGGYMPVIELKNIEFPYCIDALVPKEIEEIKKTRRKLVYHFLQNFKKSDKTSVILYNQYFDFETHKLGMQLWAEDKKD